MKAFFRRAIAIVMAGVMGGAVLTGCGSSTTVDGSKTVMTVNDEKVRLGVLSFYARYYQAMMTNYYGAMVQQQGTGMFDQSTADSSDKTISTYGQSLRKSVVDDLEQMVVISQHASDKKYKVSLTSDQKKQIKAAAKAYISNNSQEVRDKIGATEADVEKLLELQTIKSSMMNPMVKGVSTKVTQKEAQQSKVTYVSVAADTSSKSSSTTSSASGASSTTSSTSTKTSKKAARAKAKETAQKVLDAMKTQSDVASADMDSVAKSVDSSLSAVSGNYTTNDTTDGTVDSSIVKAVKGLSDGTLVDHVIQSKNKNNYYVVRFDKTDDEESTASKKESIVSTRKQTAYEKLVKQWVKKADIKVNNRVLKTLTITDRAPYTLKTESTASSSASGTTSAASSTAATSSTASATSSTAASSAASTASQADSAATSSAATSQTTSSTANAG